MKSLVSAVVAVSALVAPIVVVGQTNHSYTRAQVRAELDELEQAGYYPSGSSGLHYPDNIEAAESRIANQNKTTSGGVVSGSSKSGSFPASLTNGPLPQSSGQ